MPSKSDAGLIGQALRRARESAGISQGELGRLTGMSVGQISQIESGVRASPAFATVQQMASALHISLDGLVGTREPKLPEFPASARERIALRREVAALHAEVTGALRKIDEILARLDGEGGAHGDKRRRK